MIFRKKKEYCKMGHSRVLHNLAHIFPVQNHRQTSLCHVQVRQLYDLLSRQSRRSLDQGDLIMAHEREKMPMDGIPLPGDREKSAASCLARHSARWEERYRILTAHLHYDVQDFTFLKTEGKKCWIDSKSNAQSRPASSTPVLFHSHLVLEAPQVLVVPVRQKQRRVTGAVKSYLWGTLMIPCQAIQSCEKLLPSCWPLHWDWSRDICLFA